MTDGNGDRRSSSGWIAAFPVLKTGIAAKRIVAGTIGTGNSG
ncbi:MAG: hypothetical protein WAN51_02885 [Alphaproteobacteria bacterium]